MTEYLNEQDMEDLDEYCIQKLMELGDWSENQINEWAEKRGIKEAGEGK